MFSRSVPCLDENAIAELLEGVLSGGRREAVTEHLDSCATCRRMVADLKEHSVVKVRSAATRVANEENTTRVNDAPPTSRRAPDVPRGTLVDHYRVLEQIGRGGMGEVYLARDTTLERKVAIKLIQPSLLRSRDALRRFQLEARTTAKFSHPNIVTIHGVGTHGGRPYVALEYLEGRTLRDWIREGRIELEQALPVLLDIARALEHAHARGVLHRDLKPENVHLDEHRHARVLDFGLAKLVGDEPPLSDTFSEDDRVTLEMFQTRGTAAGGTPYYMAPEQWSADPCSEATDVWAFGVIAFFMLVGRRPFDEETLEEQLFSVCGPERAPLIGDEIDLPRPIANVLHACLNKDPSARSTVSAILDVIGEEHLLRQTTTSLTGARLMRELSVRKIPTWRLVAAALALAVVALLVILIGRADEARPLKAPDGPLPAVALPPTTALRITGSARSAPVPSKDPRLETPPPPRKDSLPTAPPPPPKEPLSTAPPPPGDVFDQPW